MRRVLFISLNHTTSTYLLLFCFFSTLVFAHASETNEGKDSISSISKNVVTIKGNTTIYINENTSTSQFEIKHIANKDKVVHEKRVKEEVKKEINKNSNNLVVEKNKNTHPNISSLTNKTFSYLPYKESSFFLKNKSTVSGIFYQISYNHSMLFWTYISKIINDDIKYKKTEYNYIFCDYSICLSHLEIRSPSFFYT
ncbi:hypothetical protein [Empedobacter brevis]|uniref:hypothetical protein n=1 Tax=Empedobacter brevis TaxID=247 RepID=UPI0039B0F77E